MAKRQTGMMSVFEFHLTDTIPERGMEYFINQRSVEASIRVDPELAELADEHLTRRGFTTWTAALRQTEAQRGFSRFMNKVLESNNKGYFPFLYSRNSSASNRVDVTEAELIRFRRNSYVHTQPYINYSFRNYFERYLSHESTYSLPRKADVEPMGTLDFPQNGELCETSLGGYISIHIDQHDVAWVRMHFTENLIEFTKEALGEDTPIMSRHGRSVLLSPQEAVAFMDKSNAPQLFSYSDDLAERLAASESLIGIGSFPGEPASVAARIGSKVDKRGLGRGIYYGAASKVSLTRAESFLEKRGADKVLFHPELSDVIGMRKAKPFKDAKLRDYQQEAVGLHLSTSVGYVQACSPGMGKTVMQLSAMRERARNIDNYRGLVVVEANVRDQWKDEVKKWFPEAHLTILRTRNDISKLSTALAQQDKPVVVLMSYSLTTPIKEYMEGIREDEKALNEAIKGNYRRQIKKLLAKPVEISMASMLMSTRWHDLCADEAVVIRTGNSKQYQAMWELRNISDVAVPMSATPINTSITDLLRLISWARGNKTMFTGVNFPYDMGTAKGAKKMFDTMAPLIFRRDTSEIEDEIPETKDTMKLLHPSPSEKALISAAENELKRCYLELMTAMDELAEKGDVDKDELAKARENLREANGAWLGGKQLARIATSDPAALLHSNSMGAALLHSQGLIEAASQTEPTKLKFFVAEAQKRVMNGDKILVFTSFNSVADSLTKALTEAGIKAKAFTGKNAQTRDTARVEFQNGELDVLVSTKAGTRGLTLHRATAIFHYDIPYTLEEVIQRTGRGVRIGSQNKDIDVVFMIMADTIEHRVAEHIVEQGITASLVLDGARGRDLAKTETASTISGLLGAATSFNTGKNKNVLDFGKILGISEKDLIKAKDLVSA